MKKLPNYFVLYCKFVREHYHVFHQLMLTFFPLIFGAILSGTEKGIDGHGALGTSHNELTYAVLDVIKNIGDTLFGFYLFFGLSKDVAEISAFITYSCGITLVFYFLFFALIELSWLRHRLNGLTTQEITNKMERERNTPRVKDENDY